MTESRTSKRRRFTSDRQRIVAARESVAQLDKFLEAIDAREIDATPAQRARIEGAVTALREFTD
ncbi:MAG: hypothetical protein QM658_04030 [Gordonia sp. (in: high G+C Gram-positive bacteria)]